MKAAVLFGGLHADVAFKGHRDIRVIYIGRFNAAQLDLFDVVIVPYYLRKLPRQVDNS